MKPDQRRMCRVSDKPEEGQYGDCIRACIATLIDRDDVPHPFAEPDTVMQAWAEMRAYLKQHGKNIAMFALEEHADFMRENNAGVPYLLLHKTARGAHCVVCIDGQVIHDPAWYRAEIIGRLDGLDAYIVAMIVALA